MSAFTRIETYSVHSCWNCHAKYALTEQFDRRAQESNLSWWCPYCGKGAAFAKSDYTKLQEQLAQAKHSRDLWQENARRAQQDAEHFKASRNAYKGKITSIKKRVGNGVCPCCNRHFTNLERHMKGQHPEWTQENTE